MLEQLNIAAAGMLAQQQRIASVAEDLANADTTGYKISRTGFRDLVYAETGRSQQGNLRMGSGVAMTDSGRSFQQGALQRTDRPLDVAIQGEGFLKVKLADGRTALTRDGALHLDAKGRLTTAHGGLVEPRITVPTGTPESEVAIGPDGTVTAADKVIGRLQVLTVRAPSELLNAGDNAFVATASSGKAVQAPARTQLSQGALEMSNTDTADAMVNMIDAQRSYQLASKAITTADEMMQIANGVKR